MGVVNIKLTRWGIGWSGMTHVLDGAYVRYDDVVELLDAYPHLPGCNETGCVADCAASGACCNETANKIHEDHKAASDLDEAKRDAAAVAYIRDRAGQYNQTSGIVAALLSVAQAIKEGEHMEAFAHGELDDLIEPNLCADCGRNPAGSAQELCAECYEKAFPDI